MFIKRTRELVFKKPLTGTKCFCRLLVLSAGLFYSLAGCVASEVQKQSGGASDSAQVTSSIVTKDNKGNTSIVEQKGGGRSTTTVIKTPDGQKVITKDKKNTDITIQGKSPPKPSGKVSEKLANPRSDSMKKDFKEHMNNRLTPEKPASPSKDKTGGNASSDSMKKDFKEHMNNRLRNTSPAR